MKLCHYLAISTVLFQLQLICKGQSDINLSKVEGTLSKLQGIEERNRYVGRGLSNRRNHTVENSDTQGACDSIGWPKENVVSGPFNANKVLLPTEYTKLCPTDRGTFDVPTTCNLYVVCSDGCLTVNRCPSFQNFNPETETCVTTEKYKCFKPETTDDWWAIILKYARSIPNGNVARDKVSENAGIRTNGVGNSRSLSSLSQENRGPNERVILLEPPTRKEETQRFGPGQRLDSQQGDRSTLENIFKSESPFSPGSQINCREEQVGNFAHPDSCHLYIQCANGNQLTQRCPPGTVFNPDLTQCDWSRNVPECNTEVENSKLKPFISKNSRPEAKGHTDLYGNREQHLNSKRQATTEKSSRLCTVTENYIEPDPEYCNKYQVCSNGRIFIEVCGPGTLFDPLNSVCNFPDKVDCESRKADLGTYGCQKQHTYRTSHWEFCNKFVECDKGVLAIKSCPSGLVYDVDSTNCDYAHKIECRKPISLEHDTDINSALPVPIRSVRSVSEYICEFNYIAPHPRCNKFVECEEKRLFVKSCGPGTVYNKYIGQCDWAYNTREPDETDCTTYKECKGGEWKGRSCKGGFLFNSATKKCDRPENVECTKIKEFPTAESK